MLLLLNGLTYTVVPHWLQKGEEVIIIIIINVYAPGNEVPVGLKKIMMIIIVPLI